MKIIASILVLSYALAAFGSNTPSVAVTLSDTSAVCIDGSPYKYYVSIGSNATSFYIYHQGGGWCQSPAECASRALGSLGSSKLYPPTKDLQAVQTKIFMNRDRSLNPLMHDWNFIYLPYCDGGSFTGNSSTTYEGVKLHFRGLAIRQAVIRSLSTQYGFQSAERLVVGGCSAGGAATYFHLDWYAQLLPRAKVRGIPDSGWFLDGNYARDGKADYDSLMEEMFTMIDAAAGLPAACTRVHGYRCLFAPIMIPFVKTPLFALNSRYDASMADGDYGNPSGSQYHCASYTGLACNASSVNDFGAYVAAQMKAALVPPHGAFLDSCFRHCSVNCPQYDIKIGHVKAAEAVAQWYLQGSAAMPHHGFYDQGAVYPCKGCCY